MKKNKGKIDQLRRVSVPKTMNVNLLKKEKLLLRRPNVPVDGHALERQMRTFPFRSL